MPYVDPDNTNAVHVPASVAMSKFCAEAELPEQSLVVKRFTVNLPVEDEVTVQNES